KHGKSIYVVGNRTVKNVELPTDQFIAEKFEENNFKHLITYKRALSNKAMPSKNSPTNEAGKTVNTMLFEYVVVCEKI
ncbi:MAG: modification methylase, partial [Spirochaetaceae bacterium]|nr:modification methylase [Spirochaetaceae bacterium]